MAISPKPIVRLLLAKRAIVRAKVLMDLIKQQNDEQAKYTLYAAATLSYGRPFTDSNRIGPLDDKYIPSDMKNTHDKVIKFRNEVAAHSDGNNELNTFEVHWNDTYISIEELYPYPSDDMHHKIEMLMNRVIDLLAEQINKLLNSDEILSLKMKKGAYKISLEKTGEWLIPIAKQDNSGGGSH